MAREFLERYQPFVDAGWRIKPTPYRVDSPDGTRAGFVAKVYVIRTTPQEFFTTPPLLESDAQLYATEEEADGRSVWLGLAWLEQNAAAH